jgi:hypothetical protein
MKKTLVSFTISFACLIGFCTFANADTISITTADVGAWQVAKLIQAPVAGGYSKYNRATTDVIFKNYIDGYSTIVNSGETLPRDGRLTNPDKILSRGDVLTYGAVKQNYTTKALPSGFQDIALTTAEARSGSGRSVDGNYYDNNNVEKSGYYAFQTTFSLTPETLALSGAYMNINLDIIVDDFLEGIFLNGHELTAYSPFRGAQGMSDYGVALLLEGFNGSILLDDLIEQGWLLTDGANTLEFVTRNNVINRDGINDMDTSLYFAALGDINFGDQQYEHSFAPTPEPATLLICLTCGGLALAIRRRKNKKTE